MSFSDKFGTDVTVGHLPIQFLPIGDSSLSKLRAHAHSPVSWFRLPYAQVVLVCSDDLDEYKKSYRGQLRGMVDTDTRLATAPELIFVYVRPPSSDPTGKGPAKIYDSMRRDLAGKKRWDRCVRLDPPFPGGNSEFQGLDDLRCAFAAAIRSCYESRTKAYDEEARRILATRAEFGGNMSTLHLIKDGAAAMMETAGLYEDALREYTELEVAYQEDLKRLETSGTQFGWSLSEKEDEAQHLWSSWRKCRQVIAASGDKAPPEFILRQHLFASQLRLLLKLHRYAEALEKGRSFIQAFSKVLDTKGASGDLPTGAKQAWVFAAATSLAFAVSTAQNNNNNSNNNNSRQTDSLVLKSVALSSARRVPMKWESMPPKKEGASIPHLESGDSLSTSSLLQADEWQLGPLPSAQPIDHEQLLLSTGESSTKDFSMISSQAHTSCTSNRIATYTAQLYTVAREELVCLGSVLGLKVPHGQTLDLQEALEERKTRLASLSSLSPSATAPEPLRTWQSLDKKNQQNESGKAKAVVVEEEEDLDATSSMQAVELGSVHVGLSHRISSERESVPLEIEQRSATPMQQAAEDSAATGQVVKKEKEGGISISDSLDGGGNKSTSQPSTPMVPSSHHQVGDEIGDGGEVLDDPLAIEMQLSSALPSGRARRGGIFNTASTPRLDTTPFSRASTSETDIQGLPPPPALLQWLGNWALRLGLSTQEQFSSLWAALTSAAARYYLQAGRGRNVSFLQCDLADWLCDKKDFDAALPLYNLTCRQALSEGWLELAAATLPKLALCQSLVVHGGSTDLPYTLIAMLQCARSLEQQKELCRLLFMVAQGPELAGIHKTDRSMTIEGSSTVPVHSLPYVLASPVTGAYSRFFKRTDDKMKHPILVPTSPRGKGAPIAHVGEVVVVELKCSNKLPYTLELRDLNLVLECLQEVQVVQESSSTPPPKARFAPKLATPTSKGGMHLTAALGRSFEPTSAFLAGGGGGPSSGTPPVASLLPAPSGGGYYDEEPIMALDARPKFVSVWQCAEEIMCPLVGPKKENGTSDDPKACFVTPLKQTLRLPPGDAVLAFMASPVKQGLYRPREIRYTLGYLPLSIPIKGTCYQDESADTIVLSVRPAEPLMNVHLVAPGGMIIAGQQQWLGLALDIQEGVTDVRVDVAWPGPPQNPVHHHRESSIHSHLHQTTPFVMPLGKGALAQTRSPDGGGDSMVLVQQSSDIAAEDWVLADGKHQHYIFPNEVTTAWWWVDTNAFLDPVNIVRVLVPAKNHHHPAGPLDGVVAHTSPLQVRVPVHIEYVHGSHRSHCQDLNIPIQQPFHATLRAFQLTANNGPDILIQARLTSNVPSALEIVNADLELQSGLILTEAAHVKLDLLPLHMEKGSSVSFAFSVNIDPSLVEKDERALRMKLAQAAKLQPTVLNIVYRVGRDESLTREVACLDGSSAALKTPGAAESQKVGCVDSQDCLFRLPALFELGASHSEGSIGAMDRVSVHLQFLGPFSGTVQSPFTLCWRLERVVDRETAERVKYEISVDSNNSVWHPTHRRVGNVLLGQHAGASATIEASWTPLMTGALPVPCIKLLESAFEETSGGSETTSTVHIVG